MKLLPFVAICALFGLVLEVAHRLTAPHIAAATAARQMGAIRDLLPPRMRNLQLRQRADSFDVLAGDALVASVHPLRTGRGYAGPIDLLIVESPTELLAVTVVAHHETPGIGDAIEATHSDWLHQFARPPQRDLRLRHDGGDIDHLVGATVTSRAVASALDAELRRQRDATQRAPQ